MAKKMITYRGVEVIVGWPEKIRSAQFITTCFPNGKEMLRVRYGSEEEDWGAHEKPCHDCAAIKGEFHVPNCDVERCPFCGGQIYGCECDWPSDENSKSISKPPKAFSAKDLKIVEARKKFLWNHIGFAADGDTLFQVTNMSSIRLPYLSIGVQGRGGSKLIGGAWLYVSDIEPNSTSVVKRDCYKDILDQNEMECFTKEDPTPETKDRFWEFKKLEKN